MCFIFWFSSYLSVWLVAFKYHEQSRQMLRIEELINQRNEQKTQLLTLSSTDTVAKPNDLRESVLGDDSKWINYV
jgi:hypothetical protein